MRKALKILLSLLGLVFALVLWDAWLINFHTPGWTPAFASTSPDGRYIVSVYFNPGLWLRSHEGTVILRDTRTGKVLKREITDYVNAGTETPHVRWYPERNRVSVVSIGGWDLPPAEPDK